MGVTLVTGGTGLVGSRVVRGLVARGDRVRVTVRTGSLLDNIADLDVELVTADVLDRRAVRRAMRGVSRVVHAAGMTSLRAPAAPMYRANVEGTRVVLEEGLRAGVERAVHVSSVAAIGPAPRGSTADETQMFCAGRYALPYVDSTHEAERVALSVAAQGLDVSIANPAHVFGRGDLYRSSTELVRRFLRRELPAYVDGALNVVDVQDVADGILLVDERGRTGERYVLGNRNFTFDRLLADLGRLSGVEPPAVKLPLPAALALARTLERLPGRPPITTGEVRIASLWWAFRSNKARRDLGWRPAHHEETLRETIEWYREREPLRLRLPGTRQPLALRIAGLGVRSAGGVVSRLAP